MASKDVAPILAKEFVSVKIDSDRMTGGQDLLKRYQQKPGGIPWFVFLDGDGNALITSDAPKTGNVGFPAQPHEIAYFKTMLEKVKRHLTDEDIAKLIKSLEEANKAT
jgi:FixJ family two-component response regulator